MMRVWSLRFLSLAAVAAVALLLAEGLLRISGLLPVRGVMTVDEREFARLPGLFVPGQELLAEPGTPFPHRVTIDSLGFRGLRAVSRVKPPGEFRVFFAGDSFTYGHNVHDAETLPAQLESRLQGFCPEPRVVNAGVPGFTILGQGEQVARGLVLDPDVALVMYFENDLFELVHVRQWDQLAVNRRLKSRFPLSLVYGAMRDSALWRLALRATLAPRQRMGERMARGAPEASASLEGLEPGTAPWSRRWEEGRPEYRDRLEALAATLEAREIPLVFLAFPSPESASSDEPAPDFRWVVETARGLGIPTLDLHRAFREEGIAVEEAFLVPLDYHPSPMGHATAARYVAEFLLEVVGPQGCRG